MASRRITFALALYVPNCSQGVGMNPCSETSCLCTNCRLACETRRKLPRTRQLPDSGIHDKSLSRGQKLSSRAQEERVKKFFAIFSFAVVASRQLFLQYAEPDIHLLSQPPTASTED